MRIVPDSDPTSEQRVRIMAKSGEIDVLLQYVEAATMASIASVVALAGGRMGFFRASHWFWSGLNKGSSGIWSPDIHVIHAFV